MLHKVGVEDNTSYYGGRGNRDFILNVVWNKSFNDKKLDKHLSASKQPDIKNEQKVTQDDK